MKTILKILGVIVLLLIVYTVIALLAFGNNYHYEKSVVMNAPKEKVWQQINSMKAFNQWNPWMKLDPNMRIVYSGSEGQIGDKYCWDSKMMMQEQGVRKSETWLKIKSRKQK